MGKISIEMSVNMDKAEEQLKELSERIKSIENGSTVDFNVNIVYTLEHVNKND